MISPPQLSGPSVEQRTPSWQKSLGQAVKSLTELYQLLDLHPTDLAGNAAAHRDFPVRVPLSFVRRMRRGDPNDPLLRQILPIASELQSTLGYTLDPLAESRASATPGLLHKYHGRVLLVVTGACAVHCRYCFRRHFPYGDHTLWGDGWQAAARYIADDPGISEVILSGGDPLVVTDDKLETLAAALDEIPHLRRLRIHTRLPIVLPERVDERLLDWLTASRLQPVVVVHANHPNEIGDSVRDAIARLRTAGITVLNQAVLLAGINDDAPTLRRLSETLFAAGVLPYYLHLTDPVEGTAHFTVDDNKGRRLLAELMRQLPGYLVPRLCGKTRTLPPNARSAHSACKRE